MRTRAQAWAPSLWRWTQANSFAPTWLPAPWRRPVVGYLVATLAQVGAVLSVWLFVRLEPSFSVPDLLPFLVITLIALTWGAGPGLWAIVVGLAMIERAIEVPWSADLGNLSEVALFVAVGAVVTLVASQTERARREAQALSQREAATSALLDAVIEAMTEGVQVLDRQGHTLRANPTLRALLAQGGFPDSPAAALPQRLPQWQAHDDEGRAVPPDATPAARVLRGEVFTGPAAMELRVWARDRQEREVSVSGAPVRDQSGQRVGGVLVVHDVTERRRLERHTREALQALLEMAAVLVRAPHDGSAEAEPAGATAAARLAELTRHLLGCRHVTIATLAAETSLLRPIAVACPDPPAEPPPVTPVAPVVLQHVHAARLRAGQALVLAAADVLDEASTRRDGLTHVLVAPMLIQGALIGLLVIDRVDHDAQPPAATLDLLGAVAQLAAIVVERQRLLRVQADAVRLAERDHARTEFIAAVSHDLQTPLTSVRAGLDLLEAAVGPVLAPDERDLLRAVRRNTERLRLRVGALLTANRLDAADLRLDRALLDARSPALDALATVGPLFLQKGQTLETDLPEALPVLGDSARLEEVLVNLLANAHRHTPPATQVTLSGRVCAAEVCLSVRDTGPGIPDQDLEVIFARFHQRDRAGGGSGLGLSIARDIITLHGGRLWAQRSPDGGTVFHLVLPHADVVEAP